jgi:hypothetical protein
LARLVVAGTRMRVVAAARMAVAGRQQPTDFSPVADEELEISVVPYKDLLVSLIPQLRLVGSRYCLLLAGRTAAIE